MIIKKVKSWSFGGFILLVLLAGIIVSCQEKSKSEYVFPEPPKSNNEKPRYIWIDAAANFNDFANNRENITRDLTLAKEAGFTDVVVDIRPTSGDILYNSSVPGVQKVEWMGAWINGVYTKVTRSASWDYLQAFIDAGHTLGLKVHAGFNTMVGGHSSSLGSQGILFRDAAKKSWATSLNTATGIVNTMDGPQGTKFFNPANDEVQTYLINLLKDLAKYNLDGIFIDRGRYDGIDADFSDISRQKFQVFLNGAQVSNFPGDILPPGATMSTISAMVTYPVHFKKWLEFRAKTIYDFFAKAKNTIKEVNSNIKFGVYVGGWYSTYYEVGVNWASHRYDASRYYKWAGSDYQKYGYAALLDQMLIGAYASPLRVYGTTEWTMQGFSRLAKEKVFGDCPIVAAGPDVGNWDANNSATQEQENQAVVNSVKACMDECDGYFLFDMIHLKMANQWQYVKQGIDAALK
ncbi:MAG: alpha amylase family protein [Niabella sp.]